MYFCGPRPVLINRPISRLAKQIRTTYVDQGRCITGSQVVQNAGFVQVRQASHVLTLLKLRWVHLLGVILVYLHFLKKKQRELLKSNALLFARFIAETARTRLDLLTVTDL